MAKALKDKDKKDTAPIDHGDIAGGQVVTAQGALQMRLPYPRSLKEYAGVGQREWQVLIDTVFPGARTVEAVCMAIAYCQSRKLDIMKKPVHIVPVWSKQLNREVETVWPSIAEIRITASRTGAYAGKDATKFGPLVTQKFTHTHDGKTEEAEVTFPEWAEVTVYRIVQGVRCAFVGPKVYWLESYAQKSKWSEIPNEMWADRRSGQLEKCAEAAALRAAFPEELGNEYAAEEMAGRVVDTSQMQTFGGPDPKETVSPVQPKRSDFERNVDPKTGEVREHVGNGKPAQQVTDVVVDDNPPIEHPHEEEEEESETDAPAEDPKPETQVARENESPFQRGMRLLMTLTDAADIPDLQKSMAEELSPKQNKVWKGMCEARAEELKARGK